MKNDTICCQEFTPSLWEGKTHTWKNKVFLKDQVVQFLHIPLNMGQVVTRMIQKIENAKAMPDAKDFLMLCYDPSPWKSEIYMTVTKPISEGEMTAISGTFISRVFDGPYQDVPKWIKKMDTYIAARKKSVKRYYFHYAYCPKCMKKYGHNYVIAFAQV